ncbi:site-specific integrase [Streptomyces sp. H27-D2]|uniref:site-specific integrase n=1 Tax=Streptomyces sp. H27-D2 TaxID=3046304 RepID=UPI002DBBAEAE|nr:site-specific integrase [Streptomyces sp. H27-D2]MEC4017110.1 site-specific integrase [Streptomyces sp. H27-D2]
MRVQRVVMPDSEAESWTVLGDDQVPVGPIERYLAYLAAIERSPNTVKAYAHDLKDWFGYLVGRGLDWQVVTLEDVAGFISWLRLPPQARNGKVALLPSVGHYCTESSVNRKLAALASFCEFHARHGVALGWRMLAERAPDSATADYLHEVFEPTARAIDGLEKALEALGLLDEALELDLRRPQDYFGRVWSTAFRAQELALHDSADRLDRRVG